MRPRKLSSESWKEALKFINKCPLCNTSYEADQAALFAKHDAANLVHITCKECRSYFMAMIVMLGQGLSSVGMITDLSFQDAGRLHQTEPITLDEALEGVRFLETVQSSTFV